MSTFRRSAVLLAGLLPCLLPGQAVVSHPRTLPSIKVVLVGDSTVATQGGWGPGFCSHLAPEADCIDLAVNGRSSKSYLDEGLWSKALQERAQFYFIQFGHNDQKALPKLHTDPETSFKTNLRQFIRDVRTIGGQAVLVTSLTRRNFKEGTLLVDPLREYAAATRAVAAAERVPLIDLYQLSRKLVEPMTQEQADQFDMLQHEDAKAEGATAITPDRTHLNALGKQTFGDMVAEAAYNSVPELKLYIQVTPSRAGR